MSGESYLDWVNASTDTVWWCDTGVPEEINRAVEHGCRGVTTNPLFSSQAVATMPTTWNESLIRANESHECGDDLAEELTRIVVTSAGETMRQFVSDDPRTGLVCGQINPSYAFDRVPMAAMVDRYATWMGNISIKVPCTEAGLDVMEEAIANGINVTSTISFSVPQVVATAEMYGRAKKRAHANGNQPGRCFSVIIFGRTNDYVLQAAMDSNANITREELSWAGVAVSKRAIQYLDETGSETPLIVGGFREVFHLTELIGASIITTINTPTITTVLDADPERVERIDEPVDPAIMEKLLKIPAFRQSYEPDGMDRSEFVGYGPVQRTVAQFADNGWNRMRQFSTKEAIR